jgi:hypothetical protein
MLVNTNRVQIPPNAEGRFDLRVAERGMEGIQHATSSYKIRVRGFLYYFSSSC